MKKNIRNSCIATLPPSYFFSELEARKNKAGPGLISLGMGDAIQPLSKPVTRAIEQELNNLSFVDSFSGYGPPEGLLSLRQQVAKMIGAGFVEPDEVFISDGAKCDISRLQSLFSTDAVVGIQDPVYPQYVDVTSLAGRKICFLPCVPENHYFPSLDKLQEIDLLYFCAPNNPTGVMPSRKQLEELLAKAAKHGVLILFDTAYWGFIRNSEIPKSIYELPFARETVIEVGSFSKLAGFTGVRAGWTIVPKQLQFSDGSSVHADWSKVINVTYNGTSRFSQKGALGALTIEGQKEISRITDYYLSNAQMIRSCLESMGVVCTGGFDCPFVWARFPDTSSWEMFTLFISEAKVVTTPGVGFGSKGEGFVRFSGFCRKDQVEEACRRLKNIEAMQGSRSVF